MTTEKALRCKTWEVKAIIEGRKTMKREIVRPQPEPPRAIYHDDECIAILGKNEATHDATGLLRFNWRTERYFPKIISDSSPWSHRCPYPPGSLIYLRERYFAGYPFDENEHFIDGAPLQYWYYADGIATRPFDMSDSYCHHLFGEDKSDWPSWRSAATMPKEAARIWLEVIDVRVERLQEISEADAQAEGYLSHSELKEAWVRDYGKWTWEENPFVWVLYFKVLSTTGKP
jgi:hypothetical protein